MKRCKIKFSDICAYMALLFSMVTIVLWICNVGGFTVVSLDSFVGVIVALLAIIVTFVTGWQIYNTIELKEHIKKVDDLNTRFNNLEKDFSEKFDSLQRDLIMSMAGNYANLGNILEKEKDYEGAFVAYHTVFLYAIICCSPRLDLYVSKLKALLPHLGKIEGEQMETLRRDIEKIRTSDPYIQYFKEEYDAIITKLYSQTENNK